MHRELAVHEASDDGHSALIADHAYGACSVW